ncbi:hypothetical protein [Caulobacter sp.]|uniref:hypothetical protein n=1 Tax=Caulobacter sp. TaxID=78 RepID=UPI003BA9B805
MAETIAPIPGLDAVLARSDLKYLVVGEFHGTAEMPAAFGDMAFAAVKHGPVTVSLEMPTVDQPSLERYVHSAGSKIDRANLLTGSHWTSSFKDGRSSQAMFNLVERLRVAIQAHQNLKIAACQPVMAGDPASYEKAMGECWTAAGAQQPKGRVLILVGNMHASLTPIRDYAPAASYLPLQQTVSLNTAWPGGQAWNCQKDGCGPHPMGDGAEPRSRGVHLTPASVDKKGFDGVLAPGGRFNASSPALP